MTRSTDTDTTCNRSRRRIAKLMVAGTAALGVATVGAWSASDSGSHVAQQAKSAATSTQLSMSTSVNAPKTPAASRGVSISHNAYSPSSLTVSRGTTVTWTNHDRSAHNVVGGPLHSPTLKQGASYSYTFKNTGKVSYICTFHPFMHGSVTVK